LKIRVTQAPVYIDFIKALGANPTPLGIPELYSALEQRAVDGMDTPLSFVRPQKYNEVQKHLVLSRHVYNAQVDWPPVIQKIAEPELEVAETYKALLGQFRKQPLADGTVQDRITTPFSISPSCSTTSAKLSHGYWKCHPSCAPHGDGVHPHELLHLGMPAHRPSSPPRAHDSGCCSQAGSRLTA
jgi:hypothetical protein